MLNYSLNFGWNGLGADSLVKMRDSEGSSLCDRCILVNDNSVVSKKLTIHEIRITGTIDVLDKMLRITVVLIGVFVMATVTAAIMHIILIVGWSCGNLNESANPTTVPR